MILCIDIDAFFVSVEQALNPHLRGKPVIVGGQPNERGVVASASYEARRYGVRAGMPLSHAHRLCPQAIFLYGNYRNYETYSEKFYEILTHYSPTVEMTSLDEAFLDIKGTQRLFGEPQILGQKLKSKIQEKLSIPTTIGIARNRTIAKIAADHAKPDGLLFIPRGSEQQFILPLSVDVLPGIGPKNLEVLNRLGISKVEDFLKTPSWILNLALGVQARLIRFLIQGGDYRTPLEMPTNNAESIKSTSPVTTTSHGLSNRPAFLTGQAKSVSRETTFAEDTLDLEFVESLIYYLLERACHALRAENLLAQKATVKVRFSDFKTVLTQKKISATNCQQIIFPVAKHLLRSLLKERKRIRLVGVNLSNLISETNQYLLFDKRIERLNHLNLALDRVRIRYGFGSVLAGKIMVLQDCYTKDNNGYILHTPSLSQ